MLTKQEICDLKCLSAKIELYASETNFEDYMYYGLLLEMEKIGHKLASGEWSQEDIDGYFNLDDMKKVTIIFLQRLEDFITKENEKKS